DSRRVPQTTRQDCNMTWYPPTLTGADYDRLNRTPFLRQSDELAAKSMYGPSAGALAADPDIKKFLIPNLKLNDREDPTANAFSRFNTLWVLSPDNEDVGIWGQNVTSNFDEVQAQKGGHPVVTGWFEKIGKIPPGDVMRSKFDKLTFQRGFKEAYQQIY